MRLQEMARTVCADDPRTHAQRRADALVALADGTGTLHCTCGRKDCGKKDCGKKDCGKKDCGATTSGAGTPRKPLIQVGVSLDTLLGLTDHPGFLHGFGAIDADLARLLAVDGRWKLIVDAAAGHTQDPLVYRLTAELDRWIRAQDGTCRFPGCTVPAWLTDIDHGEPFEHESPDDGGTSGRILEWTSPTGDVTRTYPTGATYLHPDTATTEPEPETFGGLVYCDDPEFAAKFLSGQLDETLDEQERRFLDEIFATPTPPRRQTDPIPDLPPLDLDELAPF